MSDYKLICPDCGLEMVNGMQTHTPDTCILNLREKLTTVQFELYNKTHLTETACLVLEKQKEEIKKLEAREANLFQQLATTAENETRLRAALEQVWDLCYGTTGHKPIPEYLVKMLGIVWGAYRPRPVARW